MNNIEKKVRYLLVSKKITLEKLCENMDMSKQNLYHIFKKNDISVSYLEKISNIFNVPITYFFDDIENIDSVLPVPDSEQKSIEYWKKKYLNEKKEKLQERKEKRILIDTLSK